MRPLVIGLEQVAQIEAAIARARRHPIQLADMATAVFEDQGARRLKLSDRRPGFEHSEASETVLLPIGYLAAISFELQRAGLCRHLSVSVGRPGKVPNPAAVKMIAIAFGFPHFPPAPGHIWVEEFAPGHEAVNVVQLEPT
jgi:hypothetical protein